MYAEYWGLTKHPFDNVPDPEMYFDMHQSVDTAVCEVLFAIEEGDECLAVVIGPVGVGKTMCLRIVLDSLDHERHRIAFVTNPDMTFPQLLREIIGQLEGKQCEETRKDRLFEMFNKLIFDTSDKGKRVVIFIDEGNVIKPHNLESLRLLTNMQDDKQNLFTIILAGQPELGKRLEDPRRANLFQRIGVYCKIEGIDSAATMKDYVEHRLERAGLAAGKQVFTDKAYQAVWDASEGGIPRIINKICKLSLKAAETNGLKQIDANVINSVAGRFMRTYRKQTRKPDGPQGPVFSEEAGTLPPIQELPKKHSHPKIPKEPRPTERLAKPKHPATAAEHKPVTESTPAAVTAQTQVPTPSPEIKAKPIDGAVIDLPAPVPTRIGAPRKQLSDKELEDLASKLATERVKTMKHVSDPFEAWEKTRQEILAQIKKNNS